VFEQVTMQSKHSALSWLNVRRMINVIKTSVKDFLMFSLEEPNDDFARRQIVTACTQYLQTWKDARGILDFSVVVSDDNNSAAQFNLGILKVAFFITPIIPIHEIQVDVVVTKKGVSFSEINIQALA
jgi:phage tail sheath protein FI